MAKIAFIGRERILQALTYFGTTVFRVTTSREAEVKLQELLEDQEQEWGIIYIEEPLAEPFIERIVQLNRAPLPVISLFPSTGEKKGISGHILNKLVRKVTGVDIRLD
jgi:vacuolar-type H+-ATPase subunit F/Vma7